MNSMSTSVSSFLADERGTETVEWALMAGLLVGGLLLTIASVGLWIKDAFEDLKEGLDG